MIILIRHGEAEKAEGRAIGQSDLPLSSLGTRQAETIAQALQHIQFKKLITSPLARTYETAAAIGKVSNQEPIISPELAEINLGKWDGLSFSQIKKDFPIEYAKRGKDIANYRPPAGESFADLAERVKSRFCRIIEEDEPTVIITHAGVIRVIMHIVLEIPMENIFQISPSHCHSTILIKKNEKMCLKSFNLPPDSNLLSFLPRELAALTLPPSTDTIN